MRKALVRYITRGATCRVTRNKDVGPEKSKDREPQTSGEGGSPQVGTCTARDKRRRQSPSGDMHSLRQRAPRPAEKAAVSKWRHAQPKTESPQTSGEGGSLQVETCTAKDREPPDQQRRRQSPSGDMHSQRQKKAAVSKWRHAQPKTESPPDQ
jgi:hypothetical protein